jgi:hypothetical protein
VTVGPSAQQIKMRPLIGWLGGGSPAAGARQLAAFYQLFAGIQLSADQVIE